MAPRCGDEARGTQLDRTLKCGVVDSTRVDEVLTLVQHAVAVYVSADAVGNVAEIRIAVLIAVAGGFALVKDAVLVAVAGLTLVRDTVLVAIYAEIAFVRDAVVVAIAAGAGREVDMVGNASEWVGDWYDDGYYAASPRQDPQGPVRGTRRVLRGGDYTFKTERGLRASTRKSNTPGTVFANYGFRCAHDGP